MYELEPDSLVRSFKIIKWLDHNIYSSLLLLL